MYNKKWLVFNERDKYSLGYLRHFYQLPNRKKILWQLGLLPLYFTVKRKKIQWSNFVGAVLHTNNANDLIFANINFEDEPRLDSVHYWAVEIQDIHEAS